MPLESSLTPIQGSDPIQLPHHAVPSFSLKIFSDGTVRDTLDPSDSRPFFRVLRQKSTALASTTGPVPIPLQHDSLQLFEEDGPVPFLPTQAACPISQPLMVGCAQGWAQFSRYGVPGIVWQASEGIVSEEVCLPQPFPKPLDFVFLVSFDSLHLFFPGPPLAWSQPASFLIGATATVFFWSVFSCIHVSLHPVY